MSLRLEKEWIQQRNKYFELNPPKKPYYKTRQIDYEAGADAILKALRETMSLSAVKKIIFYEKTEDKSNPVGYVDK